MSSMVQQAIEMGIDSWDGETGAWNWNENDYNEDDYSEEEPTWFATSKEALDYAKNNIGITITRASDGNGYIIKE